MRVAIPGTQMTSVVQSATKLFKHHQIFHIFYLHKKLNIQFYFSSRERNIKLDFQRNWSDVIKIKIKAVDTKNKSITKLFVHTKETNSNIVVIINGTTFEFLSQQAIASYNSQWDLHTLQKKCFSNLQLKLFPTVAVPRSLRTTWILNYFQKMSIRFRPVLLAG